MIEQSQVIRVMIVDDHEVVRRGLASLIAADDGLEVAASLGSAEEAVRACEREPPDVILMDILLPGALDGVAATARIKALCPSVKIVALTAAADVQTISSMVQAGASGYLLKNAPMDNLHHIIRMAHAGHFMFSPEAAPFLMQTSAPHNAYNLTDREMEVLRLLARGLKNPEIADALVISRSTVGFHVSSIIAKLGVSSRLEASVLAVKERLI